MTSETARASLIAKLFTPPFWRLTLWGLAALFAVAGLSVAGLSESGAQRLQLALNNFAGGSPPPAQPVVAQAPAPPAVSPEVTKLTQDVRSLAADRERLNSRLANLEHMLEDVTGSIKRQAAADEARRTPQPSPPVAAPVIAAPATVAPAAPQPEVTQAPENIPLPPERVATAEPPSQSETTKPEIGIDLGGASSPEALRAHWAAIKANLGPMLGPLRPMMIMREAKPGSPPYRLILGPLPNNNAAAQVCARLATTRSFCRPATFIGQTAALL